MPRYECSGPRNMQFILHEVLQLQNYSNLPGFWKEATRGPDRNAILEKAASFRQEVLSRLKPCRPTWPGLASAMK